MEVGDGDPEGWPRKLGEVSSTGKWLSSPYLTPHPKGLLWNSSPPCSLSPFLSKEILIL